MPAKPLKKTRPALRVVKAPAAKSAAKSILGRGEPPPALVENELGRARCVVVCDHASNRVPASLKNLGLPRADLLKHIAWDPGTEDIGRHVARALDATLVLASYSRLVVDLNRGADNKECMRAVSDHIRIPGNAGLTAAQRRQRLEEIFHPYHERIRRALKRFTDKGVAPVLISVHSFTPEMDGFKRPWHIGVLWNRDERTARRLVRNLRARNPGLIIGENEPYSLKAANFTKNTIATHAEARGLPYIILEFRQDLVDTKKKAQRWAEIFLASLKPILEDASLYKLRSKRRGSPRPFAARQRNNTAARRK
jgi:predicted N-formylglutamate amidohydrolase